ncbi:MAG: hypothetical protein DDT31_01593 [Syntrophomonadaceae bacterium]|nr:hypothetical protein [Bacillota bacterium]
MSHSEGAMSVALANLKYVSVSLNQHKFTSREDNKVNMFATLCKVTPASVILTLILSPITEITVPVNPLPNKVWILS